jgi:hypothetical protein
MYDARFKGLNDSARHVIKRVLNPRFLSQMASYDEASTSARHGIIRILNPRLLSQMASYDVASSIHQTLPGSRPSAAGKGS